MSKNKKYILSGGLAFSEHSDMNRLSYYSKKGYHLKESKGLFYVLEKGEPMDYIYSIDYQTLDDNELEDYLQIAKDSGWTLIQKIHSILILRATSGTSALYTDKSTLSLRDNHSSHQIAKSVISLLIIILALIACDTFIIPIINIKIISILSKAIIGGFIGFTIALFVGYLLTKRKAKKYLR